MSFSITDKRDFRREVRKIIDDLACDPCYSGGGGGESDCCDEFHAHASNTSIHVTPADKTRWDGKSDFSGRYEDLTGKPTIPQAANNGKTDLYYGDTKLGSWSADQLNSNFIVIPESAQPGDGTVSITMNGEEQGSFTVNQSEDVVIALTAGGSGKGVQPLTEQEIRAIMVD